MASIPLQRSKKLLESDGFHVWKVETWNQWSGRHTDLFNLADLIAVRGDLEGMTLIQCCGEDIQPHVRKILEGYKIPTGKHQGETVPPNPYIRDILNAKNRVFIHGWRMRKNEGTRDTWQLREVEFLIINGEVATREVSHDER